MNLMPTYQKIENRLRKAYKIDPHDNDMINLVKCRSVKLTQLYLIISTHSGNSFVSASRKDSLAELMYAASNKRITDPLSLSPTLVLRILEDDLGDPAQWLDAQFFEVEQLMKEWFVGYRERRQISPEDYPALPELQWSDLPNELFGLMPES
ncbi:hypothetical protein ACWYEE_002938 [Klebsiella variicola]